MPDPDRSLMRGVQRGDPAALDTLARHYAAPVFRYLVRLCGNVTLAEDLAQEVAVQLWRALPGKRFPSPRALNAWVFTVATNACRMHHRRKRAAELSLEAGVELPAGEDSDPAAAAERDELARQVRRALEMLPERERRALLLKTYADLRYQEIAQATGEPVGTVKWRISRAYALLRNLLTPTLGAAPEGAVDEHDPLRAPACVPGRRDEPAGTLANAGTPAAVPRLFGAEGG